MWAELLRRRSGGIRVRCALRSRGRPAVHPRDDSRDRRARPRARRSRQDLSAKRRAPLRPDVRLIRILSLAFSRSIWIDPDPPVADLRVVGSDRNHARRRHDLTGADVEGSVVEVAFDDVAVLFAFRQPTWPMSAGVVDHVKTIVDPEDGDFERIGNHLVALTLHHVRRRADVNHHVVVYTGAEIAAIRGPNR